MKTPNTNLDWLKRAGAIDRLREATHNLDAMLGAMKALQEGGPLRRGLAALAITAHLAEALLPDTDPEALLEQQGWKAVSKHADVDTLLLRLLRMRPCRRVSLPQRSGRNNARSTLEIWELRGEPAVAAVKGWDNWEVLERHPGASAKVLSDMWTEHKVWVVGRQGLRGELNLNPVASQAQQPIGEQAAAMCEWVGQESERTRIALIVGPTGAGKTSLARTALGDQRVLQLLHGRRAHPRASLAARRSVLARHAGRTHRPRGLPLPSRPGRAQEDPGTLRRIRRRSEGAGSPEPRPDWRLLATARPPLHGARGH